MSIYNFNRAERYAVFATHLEKCWLCGLPLMLGAMQIDHIIPERLAGTAELDEVLRQMSLPPDFNLNGFENWMPAHAACNALKSGDIFRLTPMIQRYIDVARRKAAQAEATMRSYVSDRKIDLAIQLIIEAQGSNKLSAKHKNQMQYIIDFHEANRDPAERGKPLMIGPGLSVVSQNANQYILRSPSGMVGSRPIGENLHPSWNCPRCGPTGWNGARCIICGMLDDGD
jgi:hypothetical protein